MSIFTRRNIKTSFLAAIWIAMLGIMIVALPVSAAGIESSDLRGGPGGNGGTSRQGSGSSGIPLTTEEKEGLTKAILEEYKAFNLYQSVIQQLGSVIPFDQIAASEQQHITALIRQAEKYGVAVPSNSGLDTTPVFSDQASACQAGVKAEIEDAALYDTLKNITSHDDLLRVYSNLQQASLQNHLVAFQTCD